VQLVADGRLDRRLDQVEVAGGLGADRLAVARDVSQSLGKTPARFLRDGDQITLSISGLGSQRNRVRMTT
jgi:2-keto-4-pentenoate hydratase/2-oxohepta-3-ene-1,7-dioic acid hydratase in catechol pathway